MTMSAPTTTTNTAARPYRKIIRPRPPGHYALSGVPSRTSSHRNVCSIAPRPMISIRTVSPRSRNRRGSIATPTPLGVPVRIRSPGSRVTTSERKRDDLVRSEDQVGGGGVLARLAVDVRGQLQRAGVRHFGGDPRAPRGSCCRSPWPGSTAARDPGGRGRRRRRRSRSPRCARPRPSRRRARPRSRAAARPRSGISTFAVRRRAGGRQLHEDDRELRQLATGLVRVRRVVETDAEDRARARDRGEQPHVGERGTRSPSADAVSPPASRSSTVPLEKATSRSASRTSPATGPLVSGCDEGGQPHGRDPTEWGPDGR